MTADPVAVCYADTMSGRDLIPVDEAPPPRPRYPIREWMDAKGMSVRGICERANAIYKRPVLSTSSLQRMIKGKMIPTMDHLIYIAAALDVDPWALANINPALGIEALGMLHKLDEKDRDTVETIIKALADRKQKPFTRD